MFISGAWEHDQPPGLDMLWLKIILDLTPLHIVVDEVDYVAMHRLTGEETEGGKILERDSPRF